MAELTQTQDILNLETFQQVHMEAHGTPEACSAIGRISCQA